MPDTEPKKRGRPKAKIDISEVEKLAALGCTNEELAAWFGVGHGTIDRFIATKAGREASGAAAIKAGFPSAVSSSSSCRRATRPWGSG